ncbi:OmpA family protein [uncultured Endozoicomonas sp.]|uniref:OmpA family protein n=1 Tax=uncultured Endozoicomonas sp. TaxID=432652 RepID=UPI00263029E8|nr:OmpA family protein [uncultured Endozoicomonas sp.]
MRMGHFVKVAAIAVTSIWLAGCASKQDSANTQPSVSVEEEVLVEVQPVIDPAVQAVVDSGKVNASVEEIQALLDKNTYFFPFDSSKLSQEAYKSLDVHAAYLTSDQGYMKNIVIQGHTDERGTRTYNLALGERRAKAVKDYLAAKGVAAGRIEVISFGFEKPLDPAHNDTAWSMNRRAVIITE